jgi:hypothetical protein
MVRFENPERWKCANVGLDDLIRAILPWRSTHPGEVRETGAVSAYPLDLDREQIIMRNAGLDGLKVSDE